MIDNFSLFLSHGLMILAAWRLLHRPDLENDDAPAVAEKGFRRKKVVKRPSEG